MPLMASDGIQEMVRIDDSMRMAAECTEGGRRPTGCQPASRGEEGTPTKRGEDALAPVGPARSDVGMVPAQISVFLADDNLLVREGVRALVARPTGEYGRGAGDLRLSMKGGQ